LRAAAFFAGFLAAAFFVFFFADMESSSSRAGARIIAWRSSRRDRRFGLARLALADGALLAPELADGLEAALGDAAVGPRAPRLAQQAPEVDGRAVDEVDGVAPPREPRADLLHEVVLQAVHEDGD